MILIFGYIFRFNNVGHIGGMIGGLALGMVADLTPARRTAWTQFWESLVWPSMVVWGATLFFLGRSILAGFEAR